MYGELFLLLMSDYGKCFPDKRDVIIISVWSLHQFIRNQREANLLHGANVGKKTAHGQTPRNQEKDFHESESNTIYNPGDIYI